MRKLFLIAIATLWVLSASAQGEARKWHYNLGFGGELKSGNVNSITLNNTGGIERNDSVLSFDANYAIVYGEKDHTKYDMGLTGNVKFDVFQYSRWSPFVSATYLNNKFKGYEYKLSTLLGLKYRIYFNKRCDYSVSAAYVLDYVEYFAKDRLDDRFKPQVSRLSLRVKIKEKISNAVSIKHTTFYQPSLMNLKGLASVKEDYIITSTTTISTVLGKHLNLDLNFNIEHRSLVPDGTKPTDIGGTAALRLHF